MDTTKMLPKSNSPTDLENAIQKRYEALLPDLATASWGPNPTISQSVERGVPKALVTFQLKNGNSLQSCWEFIHRSNTWHMYNDWND
jgi:hypothetical protein